MAGFSSIDDMILQITTNGKFKRTDWNKNTFATTAQVAGMWYSLFRCAGNPGADTLLGTGTNLAFQALSDVLAGATGIQHGGDTGTGKHVVNASAFTAAATTAPCIIMVVDLLGFYPITTVTSTSAQTLNNTITLPRETTGRGVQAFITPSTVMGAGVPSITLNYTNSEGTAGKVTPAVLPVGLTAAPVSSIVYSGTGAGKYGPFVPLAAGDAGIRSVQSIQLSASYVSGVLNLVLCKPLFTIPITTLGVAGERDFVNQMPSLPIVNDGACLGVLMYAGVNTPVNSALYGHIDFGWS